MSDFQDLGFIYISEQTSPDVGDRPVQNLQVYNSDGVFYIDFDADLHSFDVMNRNQRMYQADNIWQCIQTEKIQALLADNAWFGEMDHPTQVTKDGVLTAERIQSLWMPNRSHKIMRPEIKGNLLHAHIQTAAGTDAGVGMAKEVIAGLHPAFSCRAIAFIKNMAGKPTVVVRKLITYDWVLYPSHKEAHQTSPTHVVNKQYPVTESVKDAPSKKISKDTLIPLMDLMKSLGKKDTTMQTVMEAFELSEDDILGVDKEVKHAIIKDKDNLVYAKINPNTVREVKDFLRSF